MINDAQLLAYFANRQQQRDEARQRVMDTLSPYERRLVREAAVMAYVHGVMAGKVGDTDIPKDSAVVYRVVDACLAMPDLYPTFAAAERGER